MGQAVFLDRDGTINEDAGYICSPDQLVFIPGVFEAMRRLQEKFTVFIVTNQSGIGRKLFSEEAFLEFNAHFLSVLEKEDVAIRKLYYCPHTREDNCVCHKPQPFFMEEAAKAFGIQLKKSFVVGDHPGDVEMAARVGARGVYVLTGHGEKHREELSAEPDHIASDLSAGARWILE